MLKGHEAMHAAKEAHFDAEGHTFLLSRKVKWATKKEAGIMDSYVQGVYKKCEEIASAQFPA